MIARQRGGEGGGASGGRLGSMWERLNSGFWFIPTLLVLGSVVLYFATQYLDQITQTNLASLPIVFSGGPTAARSVLSTIAGSLITVVATMFSLTVVALQLASSYYSPRVLRNFTNDRGVQVVLGAYVATFLYSLLVLRIIRTSEGEGGTFHPVISVTVALVLALVCVALLIYFISHIVSMIQSSTIVRSAYHDAVETIAGLEDLDESSTEARAPEERPELAGLLAGDPLVVRAKESGYVQYLNVETVVNAVIGQASGEKTVVVEIPFGPGRFVAAGLPVVRIWSACELEAEAEEEVHNAFYFGKERSFRQDFAFGLRQLSDIALKALSPSFNDPTTAMQAMDQMEAIFIVLGGKALPPRVREKEVDGTKVLTKVEHYGFDYVVRTAFDQIQRTASTGGYVVVLERLLEILHRAIRANPLPERQRFLWACAFTVARLAPEQIPDPEDAANLVRRAVGVGACLLKTELGTEVESDLEELADLSEDLRGGEEVRKAVDNIRRAG
ncbi:MAG: DUF2254 domain-containing protein [Actinomycetota bacterium]|nr:DUF2254 domain-containing protein [Actinomycetota bacterium]